MSPWETGARHRFAKMATRTSTQLQTNDTSTPTLRGDAGVELAPGHVDGRVRDYGRRLVEEQGPHDDRSLIEDGARAPSTSGPCRRLPPLSLRPGRRPSAACLNKKRARLSSGTSTLIVPGNARRFSASRSFVVARPANKLRRRDSRSPPARRAARRRSPKSSCQTRSMIFSVGVAQGTRPWLLLGAAAVAAGPDPICL